jgi:hypothetical protein
MADLFDMSVAGYGFHLTNHVLALVALIVACFAITGYISYRNESIPGGALKGDHQGESLLIAVPSNTSGQTVTRDYRVRQPANTIVNNIFSRTVESFTVGGAAPLVVRIGTQLNGQEITTDQNIAAATYNFGDQTADPNPDGALANTITDKTRDLFVRLSVPNNAVAANAGGSFYLRFDFYEHPSAVATPL